MSIRKVCHLDDVDELVDLRFSGCNRAVGGRLGQGARLPKGRPWTRRQHLMQVLRPESTNVLRGHSGRLNKEKHWLK